MEVRESGPTATARASSRGVQTLLRRHAEPLPPIESDDFLAPFDRFGNARLVLIGEATHGTSEFYRARAAITRRLIERHGFNIVAIEADWPDAARIDRHVRHRPAAQRVEAFARFPVWMWRNEEVVAFVDWLRAWNEDRPLSQRVEFRGLDVYSLRASIVSVLQYLEGVDPQAAAEARRRYGCLSPWHGDPARYGSDVLYRGFPDCEDAVVAQLRALLDERLAQAAADGEEHFDAAQNARVVRAAERYYRVMYQGSTESWNLRDRHMFDTLRRLLHRRGAEAKAVVWAHNSHVGDASATAMGWSGEFNIGELTRTAFGDEAVLIGMGTDRGTVAAATEWDGEMEIKDVVPSHADSWERAFLEAQPPAALTHWRGRGHPDLVLALAEPRLERAIGVVYRPDTERQSHYFEAQLSEQFDAWLWFAETRAVTPLGPQRPQAAGAQSDTWPFGL